MISFRRLSLSAGAGQEAAIDRAIVGGFVAPRLPYALVAGYQAALRWMER